MTFETEERKLIPREHSRIHRSMRLVAGTTTLESHGTMLEREGASLVAMAPHASWFVSQRHLLRSLQQAAMRIVAIHTGHRSLRQPMPVGPLELSPHGRVTTRAEFVSVFLFSAYEFSGHVVNGMAGGAPNSTFRVSPKDSANVSRLLTVAIETDLICPAGG